MSIVLQVLERHCKAGLDIDFRAIDTTKKCSDHSLLFVWSSHVVIKDVGDNRWVDAARERLSIETEVEVG